MAWLSVRTVFTVTPFRVLKENLEYSRTLGSVRMSSHVVWTSCRNFSNSVN